MKNWLDEHKLSYKEKHIVEESPSKEEIIQWMKQADFEPRKFFNTSGKVYREMGMKDRIKDLTTEEMAEYLASNGMLIKRPILTDGTTVTVGFHEENLRKVWLEK